MAVERTGHWLVKGEPSVYGWGELVRDRRTEWTGIRNFEARNNLRAMRVSDLVLFYHSVEEKQVVGVARVARAARSDPTARRGEDWTSVELVPVQPLAVPVTLEQIRKDARLKTFPLVTRGRLSVARVSPGQFARLLQLGRTRL